MKAKLSYKSKRNIVISVIIVALLAVISTGTYFFIKGNDDSSAAFTENSSQIGESIQTETQGSEGQDTTNPAENDGQSEGENQNPAQSPEENNNGETTENNGEETTNPLNTGTTTQGQNGTANNNGTTTGTTTGEVPNEEYVTERVEEQEVLVSEDYLVEWQPLTIEATTTTSNLSIIRPIISAEKTADKTAVRVGEVITYTIKITNSGNADGVAVVTDKIPTQTTFVENSIRINGLEAKNDDGEALTADDLANGITVNVTKQNEDGTNGTVEVTFQVTVNEKTEGTTVENVTGTILNKAEVNGEPTGEVKNPVITFEKKVSATEAEQGDRITYTIEITNTGDVAGTAIVKDNIPTGTEFKAGSIKVNGETLVKLVEEEEKTLEASDLEQGIEVEVPAKGKATLTFEVTVGDLTDGDTIRNTAKVNGKDTNPVETEYQEPVINQEKTADKTAVVEKEELTYTITVTNSGLAKGDATVTDKAPKGTTFVEGSIVVTGVEKIKVGNEVIEVTENALKELKEDALKAGITLLDVAAKEGTATVSFTVTVNEGATGTLENEATVNNNGTGKVETPVITDSKNVTVTDIEGNVKQGEYKDAAKVGETLTYTIDLSNTGSQAGDATVVDEAPTGTKFKTGSIVVAGVDKIKVGNEEITVSEGTLKELTENDLKAGITLLNIAAKEGETNGTASLSFQVTVNSNISQSPIKNKATVNGKDTNETQTKVLTDYIIKHIYNGVEYEKVRDTIESVEVGTIIEGGYTNKETAKDGGYKFVKVKNLPLTLKADASQNVIEVYYETPVITATKISNIAEGTKLQEGDLVTYTIKVKNTGNVTGDATVTDTIPEGLIYKSYTKVTVGANDTITEPTGDSKTITWNVKNLVKGEERTITITAEVGEVTAEKTITNEVKVNGTKTDDTSIVVTVPTIEKSKSAVVVLKKDENGVTIPGQKENQAEVGDTIIYTITAKNTSTSVSTPITIKDSAPEYTTFKSGSITVSGVGKITVDGKEINVTADTLKDLKESDLTSGITANVPAGVTMTVSFKVTVNEDVSVTTKIKNTATVNEKLTNETTTTVVKKVCVSATAETTNSLDLILVLDVSGSMLEKDKGGKVIVDRITPLKNAATNLVNTLFSAETNSTITLIKYSSSAEKVGKYVYADRNNLVQKNGVIDSLTTGGGTNFYSALSLANTEAAKLSNPNRKTVVIFLTDGAPTFYTGADKDAADIVNTNKTSDSNFENNTRSNIIAQATALKQKAEVYSIGLGISNLYDNDKHIQYAEASSTVLVSDRKIFNGTTRKNNKTYYYMYEKTYAKYILNNIATSGAYIEPSDIDETFKDILKDQTTTKKYFTATDLPVVLTVPETGEIISDVTVQIGTTGTPKTYTLSELTGTGKDGIVYNVGVGFTWTITDAETLNQELFISYTKKGVAE